MASISSRMAGLLVLLVMASVVAAQPPSSGDCSSLLTTLLPCLSYVQGKDSQPPKDCCSAVDTVLKTNATCICGLATSGASNSVNVTRAFGIPASCNLKTVDPSICGLALPPGAAPPPESGGSASNNPTGPGTSSAQGVWSLSTGLVLAASAVVTALSA